MKAKKKWKEVKAFAKSLGFRKGKHPSSDERVVWWPGGHTKYSICWKEAIKRCVEGNT